MNDEDTNRLRACLLETLALKDLPRAGWVRVGIHEPESVAAHSWGVAWLVLVLCPPALNLQRALALAVVHDLAEVKTGDIIPADDVPARQKRAQEAEALRVLTAALPAAARIVALGDEYAEAETPESRFVKACDKLDMALQAARYASAGTCLDEFVETALRTLDEPLLRSLAEGPSNSDSSDKEP